jgi:uncharacterized protein YbjT (DUF2867 family)
LVLGAAGFVGRHVAAELIEQAEDVTVTGRDASLLARIFPGCDVLQLDLTAPPPDLAQRLNGFDLLVNAAGLLDGPTLRAVHIDGPRAVYGAAREAGVRRIVLISAISARDEVATGYSQTKLAGEEVLKASGVPWTILKPSLIVAKGSFGGSSVLRGLAGLPFVLPIVAGPEADFSPLHARDLGRCILHISASNRFDGQTLAPAGPETLSLTETTRAYRQWLGFPPAIEVPIPRWLSLLACRLGDILGGGPISSAAFAQLLAGNAGDGARFTADTGLQVRGLSAILRAEPADVQDRWHARLFFLRILARVMLFLTWLASGIVGLTSGAAMAAPFLEALHLPSSLAMPFAVATSVLDLVVAALFLAPQARRHLPAIQVGVVSAYTLGLTLVLPSLWLDPFGALLKNGAVLALIGLDAALREQR